MAVGKRRRRRIANNTDRPIGRGRLRKRHNHGSNNKNTVTLSIGSLVTKNGGRGSLRSRSAMLKASQLPTARVPSPSADHDKPLYQHKKFQRVDCTSPQTINEVSQANTVEDSGGKSETSIAAATTKSVAAEEADNSSASADSLRSKKNASLEALLKVTELEIIKSSTGNVCLTKNASVSQGNTSPTVSPKKPVTPNGDVNVTKNSRTNSVSKTESEEKSDAKVMIVPVDPADLTGLCEELDKKKAKNFRHKCPYCDQGCAKPSVLRKHIRAHTNERPYPCRLCHFAFKTKSNLYKHCKSRAHTLRVTGGNVDLCNLFDSNDESDKISKDGDSEISNDSIPVDSVNNNNIKVAPVTSSVSSSKPDSVKDNSNSKTKLENPKVKTEKNQVPISCGQASNPLPFGSISNTSQSKDKSNAEKDTMFSSSCSNLAASCPSSPSIHVKTAEGLRKNSGVITQSSPAKSSSGSGIVYKPKFHFTVDHQILEEESDPSENNRTDLSSQTVISSSSVTSLCSRISLSEKNNQDGSVKDYEDNTGLHNKTMKPDSQDCKDGLMLRMMEGQSNISHPTPSYSPSSSRNVQTIEGMPDKIVMESSTDTAKLAESTAVKENDIIQESTAVSSVSNSAQSQSTPASTACLPSSSISSSLSSSSTPTTATITTTSKSTLKTPKLSSPEFLEQHISNLIMRNIEIVETQNPFWSRRFLRQSSVASSQNVDAELRARDRRIPRDADGNQSKLAHALLKPDCESASYRHSTGTQSLPATPSIILSAPPFTGAVLPDAKNQIYSVGVDKNTLIQTVTTLVAKEDNSINNSDSSSAVKTLLISAKHSTNSNSDTANKLILAESDERRKLDNSVLHPQNPEGSIIKNLLLTKRTAPQNSSTLSTAVTTTGSSFPGSVLSPEKAPIDNNALAVAPDTSSIPMYTCLVCRTSFRSPETLLAHQAHYCKRSQKQLSFPLSPTYSSDSDSGRSSKSGMFPMPATSSSTTRPPDAAPKPRGRPKGSKNRPKDVLLIGNNQRMLPASKSPHKQQPPVFPQQPVVSVQYPVETQVPAEPMTGANIQYKSGGARGGSSSPADGPILKNHLLSGKLSGDKSPPLKKRKVPEEVLPKEDPLQRSHSNSSSGSSISTLKSLEELSRHPMRPNSVQLFGGEVQICDGTETKKMKVDTAIQQPTVSGSSSSMMPSQVLPLLGGVSVGGENIPNSAVVVTIAKPVLNSGGTVMQVHDSKACSAPPVCIPVVALGQPLMATGYSSTMLSSEPHSVMSPTASLPTSRFNEVGAIVLSTNIPTSLPINSSGFYSIDISHLQISTVASTSQTKSVGSSNPPLTFLDNNSSSSSSSKEVTSNNPTLMKRNSVSKPSNQPVNSSGNANSAHHLTEDSQKIGLKEIIQTDDIEIVPKENPIYSENNNRPVSKSESPTIPTITIQPAPISTIISHETATTTTVTSTVTAPVTTTSEKSKTFLAPPRPTSLAIKSTHSSLVGTTLISPETPRPKKKYEQLYLNGQYYTYLGLKCSTRVYYCCIYRPQPMYVPQSTDSKLSMYSNWQTVPAEPGPFNLSPGAAMALYDSRNKYTSYTMAHPKKLEYILTHSSYWTFRKHKENVSSEPEPIITDVEENKKPSMVKEDIPPEPNSSHRKTPPETTSASTVVSEALVKTDNEEATPPVVVKVKNREREPKRVKIFAGGYKSNEEYIYVRGRGRGKYVCEECGIRCKKPSMLKKHIRTHTDVRPFTCKHCNFSFKTKGNLTKHMKSKAHHKKCIELGIDPVPITIDEAQIDEEALAKQRLEKEKGQYIDDDEDTDEEDEDEEDDEEEEDEDDDEESIDGESSEERCGSSVSRIHPGQFEDAVDDAVNSVISLGHSEDMGSNTSNKFSSEHEIARSLLDLSNHGTADFPTSTNIGLHSMKSIPSICVGDIHSKMLISPMMSMESSVSDSRMHHQIPTIEVKDQSDPMSGCGPEELIGSPRVVWASNQKQLRVDVERPGTSPLLSHDGTVPSEMHFKYHYPTSISSPSQSEMGSSAPSYPETAGCHMSRGESLAVPPYQESPIIHTDVSSQSVENVGGFVDGLRPQVLPPSGNTFADNLAVSPRSYSPLPVSDKLVSPGRSNPYAPSTAVNFVKSYDHSPKILPSHHEYPSTPIPQLPSVPESETMETEEADDYDEPMDLSSKTSQRHELPGNYLEDISRIHYQRSTSPMGSECSLEGRYPPRGTRLAFPVNSPPPANLHSSHSIHSNDDSCDLKSAEMYEAISPPLSDPERPLEEPSGYPPTVPPTIPQNFPSPNGTRALLPAANPIWDPPAPDNSMLHAYLTDKQINKSGNKISAGSKVAFHIAASTASGSQSKLVDFPIGSSRMSTSPGAQFNFRQITPTSPSTAEKSNKPQAEFLLPSGTKQAMYSHRSMDDGKCVCSICNKSFTKPSQLRLHVNIHYFERPFRCDSCAVSFRTKGHLQKHRRSVSHYNKVNMNMTFGTPTTDNPRPFKCGDCKIAFRIHGHLAKHLRSKMHIMKLECLGKLPFGTYAEIERSGVNLNEIDTTDCENSLESLQVMAQRLYDKEPHRHQRWTRERTVSGCSADSGEVVDDSPEGGRYRSLSMSDAGHLSPEYVDLEMIPPASGVALSDVQNISDVKQEPIELLNSSDSIAAGNYMRAHWETARQTSVESLGQEYEDISDAESEPEATASCSLCRRIFKDIKALQLHLYVDHPDVGGDGAVEGSSTSSGIPDNPSSSLRPRRSVSLSEDPSVILEMRRSAMTASSVPLQMRRNTYSKERTVAMEMRQTDTLMNMDSSKGSLASKSSLPLELRGESPLPIPVETQLSGMTENIIDKRKCNSNNFPVRSAPLN